LSPEWLTTWSGSTLGLPDDFLFYPCPPPHPLFGSPDTVSHELKWQETWLLTTWSVDDLEGKMCENLVHVATTIGEL